MAAALVQVQANHAREWEAAAGGPARTIPPGPRIAASSGDLLLKCLHAHCAYYLAHQDYAVGRLIFEEINELWCNDERCRGWMSEITAARARE